MDQSECQRLKALERFDVLDTKPEETFDRITRHAKRLLDVPIALVSLIDEHRQWFKSRQGLAAQETEREISFCTHAIKKNEPFIIENALLDPRFAQNPLVTGAPHIRAYFGMPLTTAGGWNIGTLCAIDTKPRAPSECELAALYDLSRMTVELLELRILALHDSLTGLLSAGAFKKKLANALRQSRRDKMSLGLISLDIDHFKEINDRFGHAVGDKVLRSIARTCEKLIGPYDVIGRIGGEEFAILCLNTNELQLTEIAERIRIRVAAINVDESRPSERTSASLGVAISRPRDTVESILRRSDDALYEAKITGRNRTVTGYGPDELQRTA